MNNIFVDKYGNIRGWVAFIGYTLLAVFCGGLIIAGIFLLIAIGKTTLDRPAENVVVVVSSKEQHDTGIQCFEFITLNCWHNYDYYVNGVKVEENIYRSVEEGKTYVCEESKYSEGYKECKEVE